MDGLHHELQTRIEQPFGLFGVEPLHDVHRASDIGKQDGDDFALALERCPARQNPVSQMAGGIVNRRRNALDGMRMQEGGLGRGSAAEGRPAGATKLFSARHLAAAARADWAESRAAFFTEMNPVPIGGSAFAALHSLASDPPGLKPALRDSRIGSQRQPPGAAVPAAGRAPNPEF